MQLNLSKRLSVFLRVSIATNLNQNECDVIETLELSRAKWEWNISKIGHLFIFLVIPKTPQMQLTSSQ